MNFSSKLKKTKSSPRTFISSGSEIFYLAEMEQHPTLYDSKTDASVTILHVYFMVPS